MDNNIPIRLMKDRRYELVPLAKIVVLNSRDREQEQFGDNVRSIQDRGLLKPVVVNERFRRKTGKYELVCGEGRLIAHQRLKKKEIAAEVIDCDRKQAYLLSLIENIARVPAGTMWFAREVERMHDAGMTAEEIGRIVGKSKSYVGAYVRLAKHGEERLLRGVEQGVFPIAFAIQVAESHGAQIQNIVMDAFDKGVVNSSNLRRVRKIIVARMNRVGIDPRSGSQGGGGRPVNYTVTQLKRDIAKVCREKESFVREAGTKEGRLVSLIDGLKVARADEEFMTLLKSEGLTDLPELKGPYAI